MHFVFAFIKENSYSIFYHFLLSHFDHRFLTIPTMLSFTIFLIFINILLINNNIQPTFLEQLFFFLFFELFQDSMFPPLVLYTFK